MDLKLNLIGGPSFVIEIDGKFKIGCDPALAEAGTKYIYKGLTTKKIKDPVYSNVTFTGTDIWILTHSHFDHLDEKGLAMISKNAKVISHSNCMKVLKKREDLDITTLDWNQKKIIQHLEYKIEIKAIPASHGINWFARFLMEGVNGYVIKISKDDERKVIYVTSDTVYTDDIIKSLEEYKVDIMIANQGNIKPKMPGGPFTMNTEMLDKFENALQPKLTLPIHINDYSHFNSNIEEYSNKYKVLKNGESIKL